MLEVEVWSADDPAGTRIGILSKDFARTFMEARNDPGSFSVSVPRDQAADVSMLTTNRWLKFRLDSVVRFAARIGTRRQATIGEGEEAEQVLTVYGPGGLAALRDAVVHHHPDTGRLEAGQDTRFFNFAALDYTDWNSLPWIWAVARWTQDDVASPYDFAPEDWPDPDAYWMWGTVYDPLDDPLDAIGDCYFRTEVTILAADAGDYAMFFAADDGMELWVDGTLQHAQTEAFLWRQTLRVDLFLEAGTHTVAIKGTNIARPSSATNGAAVLFSMYRTTNGGELDTMVLHSDSTWRCLAYPANPPGMTPGEILLSLFGEAVDRGALDVWLTGFSGSHDSANVAWSAEVDIGFRIGETYLDVLRKLAETSIEFRLDPNLIRLLAYNKDGLNTGAAVVLAEGDQIAELEHDYDPAYVTDLLVRQADGGYTEVASGDAAIPANGTWPRIEALLEAGSAPSPEAATRMANGLFTRHSDGHLQVTFTMEPEAGEQPFADWWPGKRITVPNMAGVGTSTMVESLTIQELDESSAGVVGGVQFAVGEGFQ